MSLINYCYGFHELKFVQSYLHLFNLINLNVMNLSDVLIFYVIFNDYLFSINIDEYESIRMLPNFALIKFVKFFNTKRPCHFSLPLLATVKNMLSETHSYTQTIIV